MAKDALQSKGVRNFIRIESDGLVHAGSLSNGALARCGVKEQVCSPKSEYVTCKQCKGLGGETPNLTYLSSPQKEPAQKNMAESRCVTCNWMLPEHADWCPLRS